VEISVNNILLGVVCCSSQIKQLVRSSQPLEAWQHGSLDRRAFIKELAGVPNSVCLWWHACRLQDSKSNPTGDVQGWSRHLLFGTGVGWSCRLVRTR